jgi:hypothetical protein
MAFFDTQQSSFDPYSQDRMQKMDMLKQQSADFGASMQAPLGFLDPEMQRFLESKTKEDVRAANPKAGGSGWMRDQEANALLKLRMGLLEKNLQESHNQRQNLTQLMGIQQPMQHVAGQTGALSEIGSKMMGGMGAGLGEGLGQGATDWLREAFGSTKKTPPQNPNAAGATPSQYEYGYF